VRASSIPALGRRHWPLLAVLGVAAAVRAATAVTYWPALTWTDSWQYIYATRLPGSFAPDKPNGYMLFLRLLGTGEHLGAVTAVQHLLGLAGGVLLFALLRRLGCAVPVATLATAVVLLDAYAIALEQHVLAEALFTFVLLTWAFVAIAAPRTAAFAAAAGLLLACAISVRAAAIFILPVWLLFALWGYRDRWSRSAAVASVLAALIGYMAWHEARAGSWGLTQLDGSLLYGRVAEIGECPGRDVPATDRPLCPPASDRPMGWPDPYAFALFSPSSPAQRTLGDLYSEPTRERLEDNDRLRSFARDVIADRPLAFAKLVARDTGRYFVPGVMAPMPSFDEPITLPERPRPVPPVALAARREFAPDYDPPPREPARALPAYQRWVHTPRWLIGLLVAAGAVALVAPLLGRWRIEHRPEVLLLTGAGFALVVGSALNHFEPRFLIPAVPLLVAGGTTALWGLVRHVQGRSDMAPGSQAPTRRAMIPPTPPT
jgi:hypothetical protein